MIALIDLDSILYKAVYRAVSFAEMREALSKYSKQEAKQWLNEEVYERGINRVEKQILEIVEHVDSLMLQDVTESELFITTCTKSFRKKLAPSYKIKRKRNNYVWMLRNHYMINDAKFSETHEADDLIARRARELGKENCIVVSLDKDLKQIGGYYFSYYKEKERDFMGDVVLNDLGFPEMSFKQKEIQYINDQEASYLFWEQMLMGDATDGILGLKRVGKKTSEKILKDSTCYWVTVAREYIKRNQKEDFYINYKLLKLE